MNAAAPPAPTAPALPSPAELLRRGALLLDFDGTLVDIAPAPGLVVVPDPLRRHLARLSVRLAGAIAVVTGRTLADLDALLDPLRLATAGEHGGAIRLAPDAPPQRASATPPLPAAWRAAAEAAAAAIPGALVEHKPAGLVLHFRQAPAAGPGLHAALRRIAGDAPGFEILAASAAWELRPRGIDKGTAVAALMAAPAFAGRVPIFIGDDLTDEDGMAAARALGGLGLRVADAFGDAAGVRAWLAGLAAA